MQLLSSAVCTQLVCVMLAGYALKCVDEHGLSLPRIGGHTLWLHFAARTHACISAGQTESCGNSQHSLLFPEELHSTQGSSAPTPTHSW
jgi:hypothetical protein